MGGAFIRRGSVRAIIADPESGNMKYSAYYSQAGYQEEERHLFLFSFCFVHFLSQDYALGLEALPQQSPASHSEKNTVIY